MLKLCDEILREYFIAKNWDKHKKYGVSLKQIIPAIKFAVKEMNFGVSGNGLPRQESNVSTVQKRNSMIRDVLIGLSLCMNVLLFVLYFKLKK